MHAFPIDTGLVGENHPGLQGHAVEILPQLLRTFVDIEEETHAVTGSVAEVALGLPQRFAGQGVYLAAGRSAGEDRHRKVYVTAQHQGIVFPLQGRAGAHRNGAGDIRGAKEVLAAGIAQIKPARLNEGRSHPGRAEVRQSRRRAIGRYGLETLSPEAGNLGPERMKILGSLPFVHLTGAGRKPVEELLHHQAVFQMGFPHTRHFRLVLDGFLGRHRAGMFQREGNPLAGVHSLPQRYIERGGIYAEHIHSGLLEGLQGKTDIGVIADLDTIGLQLLEGVLRVGVRGGEGILAHEPLDVLQRNQQVGNDHRVVLDVRSADIQHPGNVVEGRKEDGIGLLQHQPLAQPAQLGLAGKAHQVFSQRDDGRGGDGRAVFPQAVQQIGDGEEDSPGHGLPKFTDRIHRIAQAVYGYAGLVHSQGSNPLRDGDLLRNTHLVKDYAGTLQLLVGLDEISPASPVKPDSHSTCFHRRAGYSLACGSLPVRITISQ